ncbi:MAG: FAD-dependent oxidoreductase [Pseudomonadota bacterium]
MIDPETYDVAVIGAGIAGASVAAELSATAKVVLLEMEERPGYHTTGRSAAVFAPSYGPQPIRALTRASADFFLRPPEGFAEHPLVGPRGVLFVARQDQLPQLEAAYADLSAEADLGRLDPAGAIARQPLLRPGYVAGGIDDQACLDIDVHALHQGYLRLFASLGGRLVTRAEVQHLSRAAGQWTLTCRNGTVRASVIVNAAGAWAEHVGQMAGAETIGLVPKRRTALIVGAPDGMTLDQCPLVVDIDEEFYLKPDAGRILISPANEDPDRPSDVQPDEMDIAICIDRIERAFDFEVRRIENRWAGLRSFVADKAPVVGHSRRVEGFFWLAGQGGYGVQTAPALARLAAAAVLERPAPAHILAAGLTPEDIGVGRLHAQAN